ncbi:hypothetical protein C8Q80DRAFT_939701 [Daedaleopsis nitida]|nr:hypothetical protein C8Q80DRAFT_939701 [Daedaleopsis nitida]
MACSCVTSRSRSRSRSYFKLVWLASGVVAPPSTSASRSNPGLSRSGSPRLSVRMWRYAEMRLSQRRNVAETRDGHRHRHMYMSSCPRLDGRDGQVLLIARQMSSHATTKRDVRYSCTLCALQPGRPQPPVRLKPPKKTQTTNRPRRYHLAPADVYGTVTRRLPRSRSSAPGLVTARDPAQYPCAASRPVPVERRLASRELPRQLASG